MKKVFKLVFFVFLMLVIFSMGMVSAALPDPLLYFNFDNNINDQSPNSFSFSWVDGTGGFRDGIFGRAVSLVVVIILRT